MPNVPNLPGVPTLASYEASLNIATLLVVDALLLFGNIFAPQWGLFTSGIRVLTPDTVATFSYKQEWSISNYPIEGGLLESYDKVQTPFDVKFRMSVGGSVTSRQAFISSIIAIAGSLGLFDAVTPEGVYQNLNIMHWDYHREARTAGLVVVDLWCIEIRSTATPTFSPGAPTSIVSPQAASGASPVSAGNVAPQAFSQAGNLPAIY